VYGIGPFRHRTMTLRPRFVGPALGSVLLLFLGLAILTPLHFVPVFPLFWVLPLLAVRGLGVAFSWPRDLPGGEGPDVPAERKEKELLLALERKGQITAARAALETSLSVAEADEKLSRLAADGHVRVHATGGSLSYSLWEVDLAGEISGNDP
jgi:hypothetical protein